MTGIASAPRDLTPADVSWVHTLNQANGEALSFMEREAFEAMLVRARYARVLEPEAAFLLAYDQAPTTDSPNFHWFAKHRPGALYIDRVAVASHARRQGAARILYEDLFRLVAALGFNHVGCEINTDPPNPGSVKFHAALGFVQVGQARLEDRGKTVGYWLRSDIG